MEKQLPQGWSEQTLGDVFIFKGGGTPDKKNTAYWGGSIPWASVKDIKTKYLENTIDRITEKGVKESATNIASVGNLVLLTRIEPGKVAIVKRDVAVNQDCKIALLNNSVDLYWSYYLIRSLEREFIKRSSGTTVLGIRLVHVNKIPILLPPLNEQKRIVTKIEELFSELDAGIASLKKAREQLKVYRQAVLKHAFEGKLTAQWRADNAEQLETPEQLLARIQTDRETRYQQQVNDWKKAVTDWKAKGEVGKKPSKPSKPNEVKVSDEVDLPEIPKGWLWLEYLGICELIRNGISAKPIGDSGTKIFRISAVRAMDFNLQDIRFINNQDGKYDSYFLEKGDLVFTRYNGTRDYVGVCAEYKGDGTHLYPDKLIQTRVVIESIKPSYLEKAINCGASRGFIEERIRTTAGQSGVSGGDIKAMPVPICSLEEQKIIEVHLAAQLSYIVNMEAEIAQGIIRSETLRQSILKKAFSGQLVPQDPNDEPASELLARIQAEKAATLAEAKAAALAAKKAAADAAKRAKKAKTASGKKAVVSGTHKHGSS
ncbi:MAG: restriction endonuclease subunit S [Oceanisphaera sp.]